MFRMLFEVNFKCIIKKHYIILLSASNKHYTGEYLGVLYRF